MKKILHVILFLFVCAFINAQMKDSVVIYFSKNSSELDLNLRTNRESVRLILDTLNIFTNDSVYRIKSITYSGAASPEGNIAYNERLADRRARSLLRYIADYTTLPDSIQFVKSIGRDWLKLFGFVQQDSNIPQREYVLQVLEDIINNTSVSDGDPLLKLMRIGKGLPYKYMYDNIFPLLRATYFDIDYEKIFKAERELLEQNKKDLDSIVFVELLDTIVAERPLELPVDTTISAQHQVVQPTDTEQQVDSVSELQDSTFCRPFYMAIKSNMLYDVVMTPNAGIEFYLGAGFSLSANWQYAWWKRDKSAFYWRTYGGDLEVRYWFGKLAKEKPLTGHHVGLYGQMMTYDFEFGGRGILAPKWSWAVGASYGYSLPIHRVLNIDFSAGVGYHTGIYHDYIPIDGEYIWQATKRRRWIGPTKFEVSLVWLIGCDNYNKNPKFNKDKQQKVEENIQILTSGDKGGAL